MISTDIMKMIIAVAMSFFIVAILYRNYIGEKDQLADSHLIHTIGAMKTRVNNPSQQNHLIIINVWANWCQPCLQEIPELNRLRSRHPNQTFIALTANDSLSSKETLSNENLSFNYFKLYKQSNNIDVLRINNPNPYERLNPILPMHVVLYDNKIVFFKSGYQKKTISELDSIIISKNKF